MEKRTFYDIIKDMDFEQTEQTILAKTHNDVEKALTKDYTDLEDFKALLSPAAINYLEPMAQKAKEITLKRFGKTVQFYVPLYLSNECSNHCIYCGFNHNNRIERKTLTQTEIKEELLAIKKMKMDNILLLTGEYPSIAGVDYIEKAVCMARDYFSTVNLEVYPMKVEEYERLIAAGVNSVYVYQETYNEKRYKFYHPKGKKSDFQWRLSTHERLCQAGIHRAGLGALIGLEKFRAEMFFMALHLDFLRKNYWKTKYAVAFPRIRPSEGGFQPNFVMSDKEFCQTIWAFRIFDNDIDVSLTTRESPLMRDNLIGLGITSISANSKTEPGGYAKPNTELEQFHINDNRTETQMEQLVRSKGYEVIYKDWDKLLN